jgi:hypothetical protein
MVDKYCFWKTSKGNGCTGIRLECGILDIYPVSGGTMPAGALGAFLTQALGPEMLAEAVALHAKRYDKAYKAYVHRIGTDYILCSIIDEHRGTICTEGRIHVSASGRLTTIVISLSALPPLLERLLLDYPAVEISIEEKEIAEEAEVVSVVSVAGDVSPPTRERWGELYGRER